MKDGGHSLKRFYFFGSILVFFSLSGKINADDILKKADIGYGEYLSAECVTCHKVAGKSEGVPSISGVDAETLATILHAYKAKELENKVMQLMAGRLDDEQIASLSVYFASLPPNK